MPKEPGPVHVTESDERLLAELRSLRQGFRKSQAYRNVRQLTSGQRIAELRRRRDGLLGVYYLPVDHSFCLDRS